MSKTTIGPGPKYVKPTPVDSIDIAFSAIEQRIELINERLFQIETGLKAFAPEFPGHGGAPGGGRPVIAGLR